MSQVFFVQGFLIPLIVALLVAMGMGVSTFIGAVVGVIAGAFGALAWYYSPLPNHNDPLMGDPGTYWGFSKDE